MIRPLIIDDQMKAQVAQIIDYSAAHHYQAFIDEPPGDNPHHVLTTDFGYRCVFSFTKMLDGTLYRDLSVSVGTKGKFPNEFALYTIAQLFGFTGWDGATIVPPPKDWMIAKDIHFDAIRVAQKFTNE